MQTKIALVLLFSLRTISLAADVTVYDYYDYYQEEPQKLKPVAVSQFPWMFSFDWRMFFIDIWLINKSPSVTAFNITCTTDERTVEARKGIRYNRQRKEGEEYYHIPSTKLNSIEIKITVNLYKTNILCSSLLVAEGRAAANITNESMKKKYPYYHNRHLFGCVVEVDLINQCDGPPLVTKMTTTTENAVTDVETIDPNNTFTSTSPTNLEITTQKNSANYTKNAERHPSQDVLIYVIPSVIGMCIIILVIYLVWIKKCCHRNSPPVQTIELNTSHHEPFYLNILFRRECDREIAELEQNHYEEIGEHIYDEVAPQDTEGG